MGYDGIPGTQGDQGPSGRSLQGPKGYKGYVGIKGIEGPYGIPGSPGQAGPKGFTGNRGKKGSRGDAGLAIIVGEKGFDGLIGVKGEDGDKGYPGMQGRTGSIGPKGQQGLPGERGPDGPQGPQVNYNSSYIFYFIMKVFKCTINNKRLALVKKEIIYIYINSISIITLKYIACRTRVMYIGSCKPSLSIIYLFISELNIFISFQDATPTFLFIEIFFKRCVISINRIHLFTAGKKRNTGHRNKRCTWISWSARYAWSHGSNRRFRFARF